MQQNYWDPLRRKEVAATPEEGVRQAFISYLNKELGYPLQLMASEYSTAYNGRRYRADIVVFDKTLSPAIIVECKAPSVKITEEVISQVLRYNLSFGERAAGLLAITNGISTYLLEYCREEKNYKFAGAIPPYGTKEEKSKSE